MADADRNDLKKSSIESNRNQRTEQPVQPGASGEDPRKPQSEEKAREKATKTFGKTGKHDSE